VHLAYFRCRSNAARSARPTNNEHRVCVWPVVVVVVGSSRSTSGCPDRAPNGRLASNWRIRTLFELNVFSLPASEWALSFRVSAVLLVVLEALGCWIGAGLVPTKAQANIISLVQRLGSYLLDAAGAR
jgi:hypothetical protein